MSVFMHIRDLDDPVERCWLVGRALKRWKPAATTTLPPEVTVPPAPEAPGRPAWRDLAAPPARGRMELPGSRSLPLFPGQSWAGYRFDDPALAAAFHGFSWLAGDPDGGLLATFWPAWIDAFADDDAGQPAWQPDIVAERTLALLGAAARIGLPGPASATAASLTAHVRCLATSLSRAGTPPMRRLRRAHALARAALLLAMPATADFGLKVVTFEAGRLLCRSGISALGSTHFHLLLCQSLADLWLAVRRHRPQAGAPLEALLRRALAPMSALRLPGGLPLIGDIAESLPPGWLDGLVRGNDPTVGWTGRLDGADRDLLTRLRDDCCLADLETLRADGWLRADVGPWSGLWHVPQGWPDADSHDHQDLGAPELHLRGVPVFVDPGGSPVGACNGGAACRSAAAHGGLQLDGTDPIPCGRPHYDDAFRRHVTGRLPTLAAEFDGATLEFGRLAGADGLREGHRHWRFSDDGGLVIEDLLNGNGRYRLDRRLVTPLAVERISGNEVGLAGGGVALRLTADAPVTLSEVPRHAGYGDSRPLTMIDMAGTINLPWRGSVRVVPA